MELILKNKIIFLLVGLVSGVALSLAIIFLISSSSVVETKPYFSLDSGAYRDNSVCPNYPSNHLVGTWEGKKEYPQTGKKQIWTTTRNANGTFRIDFEDRLEGKVAHSESGLWSYSGCLYTTIIKTLNDQSVLFEEVYRVHHLNKKTMEYTNFRTGETFTVYKVAQDDRQ